MTNEMKSAMSPSTPSMLDRVKNISAALEVGEVEAAKRIADEAIAWAEPLNKQCDDLLKQLKAFDQLFMRP